LGGASFSVKKLEDDLRNVHEIIERSGGFEATTERFYVIASGSESRRTVAVYAY